jgi:hypothetical protein
MRHRLGWDIALSHDGPYLFLYADTEARARAAEGVVRDVLAGEGLVAAGFALDRWHPAEQQWQDASAALPDDDEGETEVAVAERPGLVDPQSPVAAVAVQPGWEVRAGLPSRRQAAELARRLRAKGWLVSQRWKDLTVNAVDEDEVNALVQALTQDAAVNVSVRPRPDDPLP